VVVIHGLTVHQRVQLLYMAVVALKAGRPPKPGLVVQDQLLAVLLAEITVVMVELLVLLFILVEAVARLDYLVLVVRVQIVIVLQLLLLEAVAVAVLLAPQQEAVAEVQAHIPEETVRRLLVLVMVAKAVVFILFWLVQAVISTP
jgi:hypothetical protein